MVPSGILTRKLSATEAPITANVSWFSMAPRLFHLRGICKERNVFSCMVCTCVGGIISVICSQDQKVILPHFIHEDYPSPLSNFSISCAISFRISSVSPQSIEIHQVYKTKSMKIFFADLHGLLHAVYRAVRVISLCDSLATENIVDLAQHRSHQGLHLSSAFERWFFLWASVHNHGGCWCA